MPAKPFSTVDLDRNMKDITRIRWRPIIGINRESARHFLEEIKLVIFAVGATCIEGSFERRKVAICSCLQSLPVYGSCTREVCTSFGPVWMIKGDRYEITPNLIIQRLICRTSNVGRLSPDLPMSLIF